MLTPNGGVFGRNPDFNNVTVAGKLTVNGDTLRIITRKAPASNAAGTAGDVCIGEAGGTHYLYYCIANNNWGRVAFTTGY